MIAAAERKKMLAVRLCGERALMRRESIGVIWHPPIAVAALQSLADAAERAGTAPSARGRERARAGA